MEPVVDEYEDSLNPFSLYGTNVEEISDYLNGNLAQIQKNDKHFKTILDKHLNNAVFTKPFSIEIPPGQDFQWINTSRPLLFESDLKDKIYVLDFFTYCCINCIHILPFLKRVEEENANNPRFALIGVHSPKFINEKDISRVKDAVLQNNIHHPVINDSDCVLWKKFKISCWPTVFVVGPSHNLLFILIGETQIEKLSLIVKFVDDFYRNNCSEIDSASVSVSVLPLLKPSFKKQDLCYPGNISSNGEFLLLSDTRNNCLLLMTRDLKVVERIGSNVVGHMDGPFTGARFSSPYGTAWYKDSLYVADTENHSIRKVNFSNKEVTTVFKGSEAESSINGNSVTTKFLSPWDVCIGPKIGSDLKTLNVLYIAVAGSHQIWSMDLDCDDVNCIPFAGSGKEENRKNTYRFRASFAQPSGIEYSEVLPSFLFVADSESSTVKSISLVDGSVNNIVGGSHDPSDLFAFGDEDGIGLQAKLQHPMSLCVVNEEVLAVADTYNHKIKLVNVKKKSADTFRTDIEFCEPSGLCICDDNLYIADTNNHRVKKVKLEPVLVSNLINKSLEDVFYKVSLKCPRSASSSNLKLKYDAEMSFFFHLNSDAGLTLTNTTIKWKLLFKGKGMLDVICNSSEFFNTEFKDPPLQLRAEAYSLTEHHNYNLKTCNITLILLTSFCNSVQKVCISKEFQFDIGVEIGKYGSRNVNLHFHVDV